MTERILFAIIAATVMLIVIDRCAYKLANKTSARVIENLTKYKGAMWFLLFFTFSFWAFDFDYMQQFESFGATENPYFLVRLVFSAIIGCGIFYYSFKILEAYRK